MIRANKKEGRKGRRKRRKRKEEIPRSNRAHTPEKRDRQGSRLHCMRVVRSTYIKQQAYMYNWTDMQQQVWGKYVIKAFWGRSRRTGFCTDTQVCLDLCMYLVRRTFLLPTFSATSILPACYLVGAVTGCLWGALTRLCWREGEDLFTSMTRALLRPAVGYQGYFFLHPGPAQVYAYLGSNWPRLITNPAPDQSRTNTPS